MSFLSFLLGEKKKTASVAKERLQIILAHERSGRNAAEPDYLPDLQRGDLVYSVNIGAYSHASATYFNGFPPAKVVLARCSARAINAS